MNLAGAVLESGTPETAGLHPDRLVAVDALVDAAITDGVFPGAVVLLARRGVAAWHRAFGHAQLVPSARRMEPDTIFDLASLTKVIGTLPVALRLWQDGLIDLDTPAVEYVPEFTGGGRDGITLRHLLVHTSGLPAWVMLYLRARTRPQMLEEICSTPLAHAPGDTVEYSDLGILLLGFILERVTGRRLDALVAEHVTDALDLADLGFTPDAPARARCAATEEGNAYERAKAAEAGAGFPWRTHVLVGEVHDGNAHYGMDGVAAHAGLFAAAADVASVAQLWLRPGAYLPLAATAEALADQRENDQEYPRGLGWVLHHPEAFFRAFGPRSFGHSGFTGTSVAVDPDEDLIAVLLTNRVHPRAFDLRIQDFRTAFHQTVAEALV